MHRRRVTSTPARALARHTSSTNSPVSNRHARNGSSGERCGAGWRGRRSLPRSNRHAPDGHLGRLDVARTHTRMALVTASPKPGPARRQTRPGWRQAVAASWFAWHAAPRKEGQRAGNRNFQLSPTVGVAAVMAWRRVLQAPVVQLRHRTKVGAVWRQPSRALWQRPPAVTAAVFSGGAALHRPLGPPQPVQLRRQRPGAVLQVLQVAVAVERPPVNMARPAAPVAGLRSTRTGVVRLRPASAAAGLVQPRAGRDGDLPGPARLPAAHEASPPLARLPGSDQPTEPAGTAQPERIAHSPYSPPVGPAGHGLGAARGPKATADASCTELK